MKGAIAVLVAFGGCSIEQHVVVAQTNGAVGVIVVSDSIWQGCILVDSNTANFNNTIPAVCLGQADAGTLFAIIRANAIAKVPTLVSLIPDPNEFLQLNSGAMNFAMVIYIVMETFVAGFALWKLSLFWRTEGFKPTLPKINLSVNVYGANLFFLKNRNNLKSTKK